MTHTLSARRRLSAVICGGFLGAIARALLSTFIQAHLGKAWPYDILLINLSGALLLACITTLADAKLFIGPTRRLFINVGFLGAYTTFSTLMLGDMVLARSAHWLAALAYLLISMLGGLLAVFLGDMLGMWIAVHTKARPAQQRKLAEAWLQQAQTSHLDMQDDVLLSEEDVETEVEGSH